MGHELAPSAFACPLVDSVPSMYKPSPLEAFATSSAIPVVRFWRGAMCVSGSDPIAMRKGILASFVRLDVSCLSACFRNSLLW